MKKIITFFTVAILTTLAFCSLNCLKANAFGNYQFFTKVEEVQTNSSNNKRDLYAGDIKLTFVVSNNSGFSGFGFRFLVDHNCFTVVHNKNTNQPYYELGEAASGFMTVVSINTSTSNPHTIIGTALLSSEASTEDGDIISVYLRPIPSAFTNGKNVTDCIHKPEIEEFILDNNSINPSDEPLDYTISDTFEYYDAVSLTYMLGDVDGNDIINAGDAQIVLNIIQAYQATGTGNLTTDVENIDLSGINCNGLYITYNGTTILLLQVSDVNFDGIIDMDDAVEILDYYTQAMSGNNPDSPIGTMMTTVKYIMSF